MSIYSTQAKPDPTLYSTQYLLWLGTQNLRWNQDAREILANRGERSIFLREYEKCLKSDGSKRRGRTRIDREGIKPDSWLAPTRLENCCDCGELTPCTYNGGKIYQCEQCAAKIKSVGSRAELKRRQRAADKMAQALEAGEIISGHESSFETALNAGADVEAIKALGNQEAAQAGAAAYHESKHNSPLAQSIKAAREVKHAA